MQAEYEVVIVGGGTAGCVLAARLSSRAPQLNFLLLEAGPDNSDDDFVRTPLLSRRMFGQDKYDWCLRSVPQRGLNGRQIDQTRGKMLGGSSAINSHSLVYPNREMHDAWADLVGDQRWAWKGISKCYERFQRAEGGAIAVSYPRDLNEVQRAWNDAFTEISAVATSPLSGAAIGGSTTTNAIDDNGERSHAAAYLKLAGSNLIVKTVAHVEKVLVNELRAVGVQYMSNGRRFTAIAAKEVILCAGVFGTPQLLELSGIGQGDILEQAGVEQVLELSGVGENLQDHLNYGPSVEVRPEVETLDIRYYDATVVEEHQREYDGSKTGVLAEGAAYSFAYWPLQLFGDGDLASLVAAHRTAHPSKLNEYIYDSLLSPTAASATVFMTRMARYAKPGVTDGKYLSIIAMLSHPLSRGRSHISSPDPRQPPTIDPKYLEDEIDLEVLVQHVIQLEKLLELRSFNDVVLPEGRRYPRGFGPVLADAKAAIRQHGATNYHPCGTCAMLRREDGGVVDGSLKVYGVDNLRVCDASVFPIIPRGNILTTVYAVAERAAEIILVEWGQP